MLLVFPLLLPWSVEGRILDPSWQLNDFMAAHCFGGAMDCEVPTETTWWCVLWKNVFASEPLGCAGITVMPTHYWLHNLCVHRDFRSKHVARQLCRMCHRVCRKHGRHRRLFADIVDGNEPSMALKRHFPFCSTVNHKDGKTILACTL